MIWYLVYPGVIVIVNVLFIFGPVLQIGPAVLPVASVAAGAVFSLRDKAQDALGHGVFAAMGLAALLSFILATPAVAAASLLAFSVSELLDWGAYTFWPGRRLVRAFASNLISVPIDSLLFVTLAFDQFSWISVLLLTAVKATSSLLFSWALVKQP
jgi:hypothetical protein